MSVPIPKALPSVESNAASPPDEPPLVRAVFQGLLVLPNTGFEHSVAKLSNNGVRCGSEGLRLSHMV